MGNEVVVVFGLCFILLDYLVELYCLFKNELFVFNGDVSWMLFMLVCYVIVLDGVIVYVEVNFDYICCLELLDMLLVIVCVFG